MVKGNVMMSDCQVPSFNLLFTSAYVSSFFISLLREIIIYIIKFNNNVTNCNMIKPKKKIKTIYTNVF